MCKLLLPPPLLELSTAWPEMSSDISSLIFFFFLFLRLITRPALNRSLSSFFNLRSSRRFAFSSLSWASTRSFGLPGFRFTFTTGFPSASSIGDICCSFSCVFRAEPCLKRRSQ